MFVLDMTVVDSAIADEVGDAASVKAKIQSIHHALMIIMSASCCQANDRQIGSGSIQY